MIKYLFFEDGKVTRGDRLNYRIPKKGNYLLIFLTMPTPQEIKKVSSDFKFDPEPLRTFKKETHSRKYITKPFQFLMRSIFLQKNSTIDYANLLYVLTNNVLIVAISKESGFYYEVLDDIAEGLKNTKVRSIGHILYDFLQEDVDENYDVLGVMEQRIRDIGTKAAKLNLKDTRMSVEEILTLKRQLFRMSRQFWATTRILSLVRIGMIQVFIDSESKRLLGDVHETFLHQIDLAAAQKEMVSDTLSVYATSISNRLAISSNELNIVMKKLAAYAFILLIPTLIASLYGMNFSHIPLAEMPLGFYYVIGGMAAVIATIAVYLRRKGWL